jgi:hypothetical protein
LQRMGTEMVRAHSHPDTWVKSVVRIIQANPGMNYVITDCRFENEVAAIKDLGGTIWSIERGVVPSWAETALQGGARPDAVHATDWNVYALRHYASRHIANNGSLDDLYATVKSIMADV